MVSIRNNKNCSLLINKHSLIWSSEYYFCSGNKFFGVFWFSIVLRQRTDRRDTVSHGILMIDKNLLKSLSKIYTLILTEDCFLRATAAANDVN